MRARSFVSPRRAKPARRFFRPLALAALLALAAGPASAQTGGGGNVLFGDLKVDESKADGQKVLSFDIILYYLDGRVFSRQRIAGGGRYRFFGVRSGDYDLVAEYDNQEVARIRISLGTAGPAADMQRDIELELKAPGARGATTSKLATVSAADFYKRTGANQSLFEKAQAALDKKKYDEGAALLKQLLDADAGDFQAWVELGTAQLLQDKHGDAEKSYQRAAEARPAFFLAHLNLGRVRAAQKKYEAAVEPLARAVELQPQSADANFLLGEAYLQTKKGSKAVGHLEAAARLGRADAHLRLAALYNAVGMKERAAAEYEQFLAKQPDHPEREKLQRYVKENRKQ
jgi:tetratricopeptide (TPR) repeat protein